MSETGKKDLSSMNPADLQNAVQTILGDPAFGKLLGEITGGGEEKAAPAAVPQISPDMLSKLPQMMSALAPLLSGGEKKSNSTAGDDGEKRKRLLAALRPYLSGARRDAVDSIMKVTEMTDIMGKMGLGGHSGQK